MKKIATTCSTCNSRTESIFCHISGQSVDELDKHKVTKLYKRGELLYQEGKKSDGVFCLRTGKVKVYKTGDEGKEVILGIAGSGDVLGFRSVLAEQPYHRNAEIIEDAEVCFVQKDFFASLIKKNPTMAFDIIRKLAEELEMTEYKMSDLLNIAVRTRLARLLLMLEKSYGVEDFEGVILDVRLTRQEMGEMIGGATETVIRILSDLENDKIIRLESKKIKILNSQELVTIANIEL